MATVAVVGIGVHNVRVGEQGIQCVQVVHQRDKLLGATPFGVVDVQRAQEGTHHLQGGVVQQGEGWMCLVVGGYVEHLLHSGVHFADGLLGVLLFIRELALLEPTKRCCVVGVLLVLLVLCEFGRHFVPFDQFSRFGFSDF